MTMVINDSSTAVGVTPRLSQAKFAQTLRDRGSPAAVEANAGTAGRQFSSKKLTQRLRLPSSRKASSRSIPKVRPYFMPSGTPATRAPAAMASAPRSPRSGGTSSATRRGRRAGETWPSGSSIHATTMQRRSAGGFGESSNCGRHRTTRPPLESTTRTFASHTWSRT
jgi:hypothetical protein